MQLAQTGNSSTQTTWLENGEQVWPCRCGKTHRGGYGFHDWAHHNCFHEGELYLNAPFVNRDGHFVAQAICTECGEVWRAWGDERLVFAVEVG